MSRTVHAPGTPRSRARFARVLGGLVLASATALAAILVTAAPAVAHDELVGSDPESGAVLDELPAEISLSFSAAILTDDGATDIEVTDGAGNQVQTGAPSVADTTVTQAIAAEQGADSADYTVVWKVVSSDGHPISGEFTFSVAGAPVPEPTETPSDSPEPSESASPAPVPDEGAPAWVPWVIGGVIALLVLSAAVFLMASRTRRPDSGEPEPGVRRRGTLDAPSGEDESGDSADR